jgi:hypothetical protein
MNHLDGPAPQASGSRHFWRAQGMEAMTFRGKSMRHTGSAFGSLAAALTGFLVAIGGSGFADAGHVPLPEPEGRVILEVRGSVGVTNRDGTVAFDRDMLESLGMTTLATTTPWTDGVIVFEGVLMADLLDAVHATGDSVVARALNDYEIRIPLSDFRTWPVLLALKVDGEYLRIRDKGPMWIVYPRDDYSELDTDDTMDKSIWQLRHLTIE